MDINKYSFRRMLGAAILLIVIIYLLFNIGSVSKFITKIFAILSPFLLGGVVAFVLNAPLRFLERRFFDHIPNPTFQKYKRLLSVLLSICFVGLLLFAISILVMPQLIESITVLVNNMSLYAQELAKLLMLLPEESDDLQKYIDAMTQLSPELVRERLTGFLTTGSGNDNFLSQAVSSTFDLVSSVFGFLINVLISFFFALYILFSKERLGQQLRQIIVAFLPETRALYAIHVCNTTFTKFHGFLTGQVTEACILGVLVFIGMKIFHFPFALMIAILTGFCSIIPIAGAWIGGAIGFLIILPISPLKAGLFIVFLIILQQVEGNIIYPKVVGTNVGLPAIWTLFAITLGGTTFGLLGMLIFVPLFGTIYDLFGEIVHARLASKNIQRDASVIVDGDPNA